MSNSLAERILDGDIRAAGRLMRNVDDGIDGARAELDTLFPHTGNAHIIGFTGSPGSGKSSLVNEFIGVCRDQGSTVGVIAVDPTSPFSGGAILGDRIRMQRHALDEGVFIRSVATRGNLGGLSRSTPALVQILDAMSFDIIVIETVGVGQDEVDIVRIADTNLVVTVPGLGDDIQATKAGIMEIADIFVVNKSDKQGSDRLRREIKTMLSLGQYDEDDWEPPVVHTVATTPEGIDDLLATVHEHQKWLAEHTLEHDRDVRRVEHLIRLIVSGDLDSRLAEAMATETWQRELDDLVERRDSPYQAAQMLIDLMTDSEDT